MHHCVGEYWNDCLFGPIRIVHLELRGGETATAQYDSSHDPADPRFELVELRGRFNESGSGAMQAFAETIADRLNDPALGDKRVEILNEANRLRSGVDWSQVRQTIRPLDRRTRTELRLVVDYCLKQPDWRAREDIVYRGVIAGFGHAGGLLLINQMHVGDELELAREPANPHDALAVRIDWFSHKIGYVPRDNHEIARMLDAGDPLEAAIDRIRHDGGFAPVDYIVRPAHG